MGNASGLKALQVLANAERALAIELLAGAQAVEFLAPLEPGGAAAHDACALSERLRDDRRSRRTSSGRARSATARPRASRRAEAR